MARDERDPLAPFADRFVVTDPELIYLDGNSLGRLPTATIDAVDRVVRDEWGDRLIRSWNDGWFDLPSVVGDRLAPLVGAGPGEVLLGDSTSVNLFKLAGAALAARPDRAVVVTDDLNFPTDVHVLDAVARARGGRVRIVASDGINGPVDDLIAALDGETALLSLSSTTYSSGYTYDLAELTARAHDVGALVLWDLSHSVGAVAVDLGGANVDLAVGCTYKYLNGGPGAPAFCYVRSDLQAVLPNPITAWWGHADPFGFELGFTPADDIRRFHTGTVPVLSLVAAAAGIDLVAEAGIEAIRTKSEALLAAAEHGWADRLAPLGFAWASPRDPARRGSHASLSHPRAWPITQALVDVGRVIPDFRVPDIVRFGLSPLTTSFVDLHTAFERTARLVERGVHERYPDDRTAVT